jgi:hypothetical protein
MAPPEAKTQMVIVARNLQNTCIEVSVPSGSSRKETAIALLRFYCQRTKMVEVHRQGGALGAKRVHSLSPDKI